MSEIQRIRKDIDKAEEKRNIGLDNLFKIHDEGFISNATRYDVAKRIKGNALIIKNSKESGWPGGRTHFEIDRDQILFNPNFVRLAQKTQVFIGQRNIQFKNRLMHTLEVVQFCRSIAQKSGLNMDLIDSIAYGHDIGHAPFGHSGEKALNMCLYEYFIRIYGLELLKNEKPILSFDESDSSIAYRDSSIWLLVESIVNKRSSNNLPLIEDVQQLIDDDIIEKLIYEKNILKKKCGKRYEFNPPLQWNISDENKIEFKNQFSLTDTSKQFFSHNINSLHVLLNNKNKDASDICYHTAFGILSHSWQGADSYENFKFKLLDEKEIILSKSLHETPEAFVVRYADDICFTNSDLNDINISSLVEWNEFKPKEKMEISKLTGDETNNGDFPSSSAILSYLEGFFDFTHPFRQDNISGSYSSKIWKEIESVRNIIEEKAYPKLIPRQASAKKIIRDLFWFYCCFKKKNNNREIEKLAYNNFSEYCNNTYGSENERKQLLDPKQTAGYIAYLTDEEAISIHTALYSPEQAQWAKYFLDLGYS
ncbi:HD domain-containing protein [Bacteroidota bacterium]